MNKSKSLPRIAKGHKPVYIDSVTDKLLSICMALMAELSVTRDRLETVEMLIEKHKLFCRHDIESFQLAEADSEYREKRRADYVARILRSVEDDVRSLDAD